MNSEPIQQRKNCSRAEPAYTIVLEEAGDPYPTEKIYETNRHAILGEKCFVLSKCSKDPPRTTALYDEGLKFLKPSKYSFANPLEYVQQGVRFSPDEERLWKRLRLPVLAKIRQSKIENH